MRRSSYKKDSLSDSSKGNSSTKPISIHYCKATTDEFTEFPNDENEMEVLQNSQAIKIPNFDESKDIRIRICPKFLEEGPKQFRVMIKYKIVGDIQPRLQDTKSDPIAMTMTELIKLRCIAPFKVNFDYEVKDWLTNELNLRDSEASQAENETFAKVPVGDKIPMSVNITSMSQNSVNIKSVMLDIHSTDFIQKLSDGDFQQIDNIEEEDTICAGFIIKPLKCTNDTGEYADVLVDWT